MKPLKDKTAVRNAGKNEIPKLLAIEDGSVDGDLKEALEVQIIII